MEQEQAIILLFIPLMPLIGAIVLGLAGHRLPRGTVGFIASMMPIISFGLALRSFLFILGIEDPEQRILNFTAYNWISSGILQIPLAYRFDQLTAVMVLVVTGVGSLIHIYSNGYMGEDRSYARYFAYLNLFTFAMLTLVMGNNLIVMFVGWEGVGVCSYLLIGFWYEDMDKAIAGKKAFVVNRIGDFGFLLGFFLLFWALKEQGGQATAVFYEYTSSGEDGMTFFGLFEQASRLHHDMIFEGTWAEMHTLTAVCILFFVGACGKSAQIPLYVWLPDAMAGPTPVSALIHAATMVTAGVYMVARLNFLYSLSPTAQTVVAGVGAITAVFAASIGLFQHDIKKVLAYSTVSQLGYMFIGVGVGAYSAGIMHLMTHAFFKGLMFLGAGSVIMGMHHQQDIRKMGGLIKKMPITAWTFLAGWVAIIGFPLTSGFFSKDEILWMALETGHVNIWVLGVLGALLTSFYMTRLIILTFFGKLRLSEEELHHLPGHDVHESPWVMTIPLIILAVLSIIGGFVGIPNAIGHDLGLDKLLHIHHTNILHTWFEPVLGGAHIAEGYHPPLSEWAAMGVTIVGMVVSVLLAGYIYIKRLDKAIERSELFLSGPEAGGFVGHLYRFINEKYKVDELYDATVVRLVRYGSRDYLWPFDKWIVDGAVNIAADVVKAVGGILGFLQNGNVRRYLIAMTVGVIIIITYLAIIVPRLDAWISSSTGVGGS